MSDTPPAIPGYQRFFAELKRRHVFRVMAVYGAVAFVILQVADIAFPLLGLPDWTVTFVLALTLVGFPVAIVLAWAFEVSPDGMKRTGDADSAEISEIISAPPARRWPSGLLALLGVAALVGGAWWVGRSTAPSVAETGPPDAAPASPDAETSSPSATDEAVLRLAYADLSEDDRPSIAVLPFVNMSPDPEQEYFADGMTEELLNALARVRELKVAGRTSSFAYKGEDKDLREIGEELGVRYLVEGSVRKQGDDLRITAQLVDASDAFHIWSDTYDRTLDNVFEIQAEIAESVAEALQVSLGLAGEESLVTPTADLEAYDLYLAAQSRLRQRGQGVADAIRLFDAVVERDPSFAPAWAGLALAHSVAPYYKQVALEPAAWRAGWEPSLIDAEEAANRALQLDPELVIAEVALGNVYKERLDWVEAERHYLRALAVDPDNGEAHQQYAESLTNTARFAEALRSARRAVELDPTAAVRLNALAYILGHNGRWDEAIELYEQALLLNPDFQQPLGSLLWTLELEGRLDEAEALALERWKSGDAKLPILFGTGPTADLEALIGSYYSALRSRDSDAMEACCGEYLLYPSWLSVGDLERALESVVDLKNRTRGFGSDWIHGIWDPRFEPVRNDPRFQQMLLDLGLEGVVPERAEPGS